MVVLDKVGTSGGGGGFASISFKGGVSFGGGGGFGGGGDVFASSSFGGGGVFGGGGSFGGCGSFGVRKKNKGLNRDFLLLSFFFLIPLINNL